MTQKKTFVLTSAAAFLLASLPCWAADVAGSAREVQPLLVGSPLPAVQLKTASGEAVDLQTKAAEKPSILIFYRGGW